MKKKYRLWVLFFLLCTMILSAGTATDATAAAKYKNQAVTVDGDTYYYNGKGKLVKNKFVTINNRTYYFGSDGKLLKKQAFVVDEKTYYATRGGAIAKNKIVTVDGKKRYFNSSGVMTTGWVDHKGNRYYFPKAGDYLVSRWKKLGGYTYYFNEEGHMQKNTWVDSWYIDSNGHRIEAEVPAASSKNSRALSMKNIKQNPELPTGCESVALTMVLKYYGFRLSKTTIASSYLPRSGSGNFVTAFAGNPFSYSGCGIYSPGLTSTANSYLRAQKSSLRAYDITGASLSDLYRYIDNNTPVIVWNSMYMRTPVASFSIWAKGRSWTFYTYEHCVVLCGYNKKKNKVLINDSLSGLVWRKVSDFERIYNRMGKMAVVIQ